MAYFQLYFSIYSYNNNAIGFRALLLFPSFATGSVCLIFIQSSHLLRKNLKKNLCQINLSPFLSVCRYLLIFNSQWLCWLYFRRVFWNSAQSLGHHPRKYPEKLSKVCPMRNTANNLEASICKPAATCYQQIRELVGLLLATPKNWARRLYYVVASKDQRRLVWFSFKGQRVYLIYVIIL